MNNGRSAARFNQTHPAKAVLIGGRSFHRALRQWYATYRRDLPWRRTRDSYAILVSEIMLQQTQVATVLVHYNRWLRHFPSLRSLARAPESAVLRVWQGLGYYARARNLHRCAKEISRSYSGKIPANPDELTRLPGIGRYTANAIAVFAFGRALPLIEANSARVLARVFNIRESIDSSAGRRKLWHASRQLTPKRQAGDFHSALMDLGALLCTARQPRCGFCPIRTFCAASDPASLPRKRRRPVAISLSESHEFIRSGNRILLQQCEGRWRGMWMLPQSSRQSGSPIYSSQFAFTHHQIRLRVFPSTRHTLAKNEGWFRLSHLDKIPIPTPHYRALAAILSAPRDRSTSTAMTSKMVG
jgi:A/G-specific adenine glycosylase